MPLKKKTGERGLYPEDIVVTRDNQIMHTTSYPLCITESDSGMNIIFRADENGICSDVLFVNTSPYFPSPDKKKVSRLPVKRLLP